MKGVFNVTREKKQWFHAETYSRAILSMNFHSHIELFWVKKGEVTAYINDSIETVREGDLAVMLSYETHGFHSPIQGEYMSVFIPPFLCADFMEAVKNKQSRAPVIRAVKEKPHLYGALTALTEEELNPIEQKGFIHVLLGAVLSHLHFTQADALQDDSLSSHLFLYINEHYREDITADSIARTFGYSTHHLTQYFRANFHQSIGGYINTLRLKNAIILMQKKEKSITECAMESGFGSLRTFYRVFSAAFGCSPRDYRKQER